MDKLAAYGSDSESEQGEQTRTNLAVTTVNTAPEVSDALFTASEMRAHNLVKPGTKEIFHNIPFAELSKPTVGPTYQSEAEMLEKHANATKNTLTGTVVDHHIPDHVFVELQRNYNSLGYTAQPDVTPFGTALVGDVQSAYKNQGLLNSKLTAKRDKESQKQRVKKGDPADVNGYLGPWAGYEKETKGTAVGPSEEQLNTLDEGTRKAIERMRAKDKRRKEKEAEAEGGPEKTEEPEEPETTKIIGTEKTIFHGKSELDYLGRTYMHPPTDVDVNLTSDSRPDCTLPKHLVHTYEGHGKGVAVCHFLPRTSHLFISGGMDGKVKLWDVYHDRELLRSYLGHNKAIRDISFSNNGKTFLSAGWDRWIKLWDTETGKCIRSYTTNKTPNCVVFYPDSERGHEFLTGCSDKKIYQFDTRTGQITQTYDQHLGAVNTIAFVDENRRFVSTSDDKTMRVWEVDIPIVIKHIADPSMHSQPAVAEHPSKKWLAYTSLDNQILIYSSKDKLKLNRNKHFTGHNVAGYACKPSFSPDGKYLCSGDSEGGVWCWDWKTGKILNTFKAHDKVTIGCEWSSRERCKLLTWSWDGSIKLWA